VHLFTGFIVFAVFAVYTSVAFDAYRTATNAFGDRNSAQLGTTNRATPVSRLASVSGHVLACPKRYDPRLGLCPMRRGLCRVLRGPPLRCGLLDWSPHPHQPKQQEVFGSIIIYVSYVPMFLCSYVSNFLR